MRLYYLAVMGASVGLLAAPAFAQGTNHSSNTTMSGQSSSTTMSGQSTSGNSEQGSQNARQELVQSLQKAGFTHVRVEPEVFVVHAMNAQGEPVLMRIGPDSMQAITAIQPSNGSNGVNGSGQQHAYNGNGSSSGSHSGSNSTSE